METEGAERLFERSVEKHNLRHVKFLGDGGSASYQTVKNTYPSIELDTLDCVGHYQKRIGNRLRKLKREKLKREKCLGERGKLTDATIDRLQKPFRTGHSTKYRTFRRYESWCPCQLISCCFIKDQQLTLPSLSDWS